LRFRAFIAVDIVPNQALATQLKELAGLRADLKVVKPGLLHVTLKFLGDTDEDLVDDISMRISDSVKGIRAFRVQLIGMGAFPSMSNIRVVWVGMKDGAQLGEIARRLDASIGDLGFERDKKGFVPHLTVARARSSRNMTEVQDILRRDAAADFGVYPVNRVVLKKSILSPQGPAYYVVREIPLEPAMSI
jgi:2'-5' RNA ligase